MEKYILSICIPNYNRCQKLLRLMNECITQIEKYGLSNMVEICISDDCSSDDPTESIMALKQERKNISITYVRNKENQGMDRNFLNSVMCSSGKYCWIIGNDDLLENESLRHVKDILERSEKENVAIIVSALNTYLGPELELTENYPLGRNQGERIFDTRNPDDRRALYGSVQNNCALFGFLSNVIFRKQDWVNHGSMFEDKMGAVFIQVYMNLQTLMDGAKYFYTPMKLIRNYCESTCSLELSYKVAIGLYNAVEYFFYNTEYRDSLMKRVVEDFVSVKFWDHRLDYKWLSPIFNTDLEKVKIYNKYYVPLKDRKPLLAKKEVYIFGAGRVGKKVCRILEEMGAVIVGILDNDSKLWGKTIEGYSVLSPDILQQRSGSEPYIVIASGWHAVAITEQLEDMGCKQLLVIAS